jgi:hypothetical protein
MGLLCAGSYYLSLPKTQQKNMEKILQCVISEFFDKFLYLSEKISLNDERWFGDADYWIKISRHKTKFKRDILRLTLSNICGGWWAVMERETITDSYFSFKIYSESNKIPKRFPGWNKIKLKDGLGESSFYIEATKSGNNKDWYGPYHTIDLQHPLLLMLNSSEVEIKNAEELEKKNKEKTAKD